MRKRILLIGLASLILAALVTIWAVQRLSADATVLQTITLDGSPWAAALDERTGRLFVVNRSYGGVGFAGGSGGAASGSGGSPYDGTVSVLDTHGGSAIQTVSVGDDPRAAAVDPRHGLVYVTNDDDANVSVLNTRSGAVLRTIQVGARPHALAMDAATNRLFIVNTSDGTVSVLDTRQGKVLRLVHVSSAVDFSGAAVDIRTNRAFIVGGGSVSVLDAHNGALLQTISLESDRPQGQGPQITQTVVDEKRGRVFALGIGVLSVLDAANGRLLRSIPVSTDTSALALDARNGHLLLAGPGPQDNSGAVSGAGSLQVLDAGTGTVLRTLSLGVTPSAVIVDQLAGHAIVVDTGGQHRVPDPWGWLPDGIRKRLTFLPAAGSRVRTEPGSVTVLDLSRL